MYGGYLYVFRTLSMRNLHEVEEWLDGYIVIIMIRLLSAETGIKVV